MLVKYIRKSKTAMVPAGTTEEGETLYRKQRIDYPRGVLICICNKDKLYFGWSYISSMKRESSKTQPRPYFAKKKAIKIAMDKIRSRRKTWKREDMPAAIRAEFNDFFSRAIRYYKTVEVGNMSLINLNMSLPVSRSSNASTSGK